MKKYKIIPIFVPHRGCPHKCSFCNQRHITGQHTRVTCTDVKNITEKYLSTIDPSKSIIEIAFYGGSFTAIDKKMQNELLSAAFEYKTKGRVHGIRLSTRPDCIDREILDNLKEKGVTAVELGVQSMCDDVLLLNNRGHGAGIVRESAALIRQYGFALGLQMMIGLLGDTKEKDIYTAREIAGLKPDFVRIYPCLVFKNTDLYDSYLKGDFEPLTVEQAADICAPVVDIFNKHGIKIIRLGLLLADDEAKNNFVAGPYHPRFAELVRKRC
jgi:histone acetyltransferase (RNA polymerase elongator complex component)